jgi:hypothetical protein
VFTAQGLSILSFSLMLIFGIIPLKFTWGFPRVDFGVLWLLQIVLLIVFAAAFANKHFQFLIIPIGTYALLAFASWPMRIFEFSNWYGNQAFLFASRQYWNFSGIVFLLSLLAVMGVFFLTYFIKRLDNSKLFIITCLAAIPINYLAICISFGGFFRNILLMFDFSFWMFNAFLVGIVCLALAKETAGRQAASEPQDIEQ